MAEELGDLTPISSRQLVDYNNPETNFGRDSGGDPEDLGGIMPLGNPSTSTRPGVQLAGETTNFNRSKYDLARTYDFDLPNLDNIRSSNQSTLATLGNAVANYIGQTGVQTVGGILGTAYGAGSALANWDVNKLWDNEVMEALDTASEYLREDLFKVYNSNDYESRNLIGRMFLNPAQFANDLLDTLSFTTGAILTEYATAGVGSAFIGARALKYLKMAEKGTRAASILPKIGGMGAQTVTGLYNAGKLSRQLWTGAGYEAMVESRQIALEARENMQKDWLAENPGATLEDMPEEVREDIDQRLTNMGLVSFLGNMSLVGFGNMVQFPKVFRNSFTDSRKALTRRIGVEGGKYYDVYRDLSKGRKIGRNLWTVAKNPFMEGIVEEGGQEVISNFAQEYFDRKNDPDAQEDTLNVMEALGNAFIDTYTTAEGWEEIGMGMIIGAMGSPGKGILPGRMGREADGSRAPIFTGGVWGDFQERRANDKRVADLAEDLNNNPSALEAAKNNFNYLVTQKSLEEDQEEALARGDIFNFHNRQDDKVHAYIMSRIHAGLQSDIDTQIEQLEDYTPDEFYTEFKGEEDAAKASEQEKIDFQRQMISQFKRKADATIKAHEAVNNSHVVEGNDELRDFLTHSLSIASYMDIREESINNKLAKLTDGFLGNKGTLASGTGYISLSQEIKNINQELENEELSQGQKDGLKHLKKIYENTLKEQDKKSPGLIIEDFQKLRNYAMVDPVGLTTNFQEIQELLADSHKVRNYRQALIGRFNDYFTVEGVRKFRENQKKQEEILEKAKQKQEEEEAKLKREEEKKENLEKAKEKAREKRSSKKDPVAPKVEETAAEETTEAPEEITEEITPIPEVESESGEIQGLTAEEQQEVPQETPEGIKTIDNIRNDISRLEDSIKGLEDFMNSPTYSPKPGDRFEETLNQYKEELENLKSQLAEAEESITPQESVEEDNSEEAEIEEKIAESEVKSEEVAEFEDQLEYEQSPERSVVEEAIDSILNSPIYKGLQRSVGSVLAYLHIKKFSNTFTNSSTRTEYRANEDIYDEEGNIVVDPTMDRNILSPNHYKPGEVLTARPVTYKEIQDRGTEEYTEKQFNKDRERQETLPIGMFNSDGQLVGFYPTKANIQRNVSPGKEGENLVRALKENGDIRKRFFENQNYNYNFTISGKTPGVVGNNKNYLPIFEALGNGESLQEGVDIAIARKVTPDQEGATLFTSNSRTRGATTKSLTIPDKYIQSGFVYAIVPSAIKDSYVPVPMKVEGIGDNIANVITEAIRLFATTERTEEDNNSINEISEEFDITTLEGLRDFINKLTYTASTNSNDSNTLGIYDNRIVLSPTNSDVNFNIEDIRNNPEARATIARILAERFPTIKLSDINNRNPYVGYTIEGGVIKAQEYSSFQEYLNNNNLLTTNLATTEINPDTGEKAFVVQPVILLSDPVRGEEIQTEEDSVEEVERLTQEDQVTPEEQQGEDIREVSYKSNTYLVNLDRGTITNNKTGKVLNGSSPIAVNILKLIDFDSDPTVARQESPKPKRTLGIDPNKLKGKKLDFNITPQNIEGEAQSVLNKPSIKSAEELKKRCR